MRGKGSGSAVFRESNADPSREDEVVLTTRSAIPANWHDMTSEQSGTTYAIIGVPFPRQKN
jgi:hypothetical protein